MRATGGFLEKRRYSSAHRFRSLGNDFYFKTGVFLVKLDNQGRVSSIVFPRDSPGRHFSLRR